jgi:hypothetical protein
MRLVFPLAAALQPPARSSQASATGESAAAAAAARPASINRDVGPAPFRNFWDWEHDMYINHRRPRPDQ